jgi:hypothetical protein
MNSLTTKIKNLFNQLIKLLRLIYRLRYKLVENCLTRKKCPICSKYSVPPFNDETIKALRETQAGKGLIKCKDVDDLFRQLEI